MPVVALVAGNVIYGYDKSNHQIFAKDGNEKATLNFEEDYTGNPAYAFDFFHGLPAIIADNRSLHDSTTYAVLNYRKKINIDCLYYKIKSKKNGVFTKEGICGLNEGNVVDYQRIIDEKINYVENNMDSVDISLLLTGKVKYLSIVIHKDKEQAIYKIYTDKQSLLDDEYFIALINSSGLCEAYENNPWVVYNNNLNGGRILKDDEKEGLIPATPSINSVAIFSSYPAVNVKYLRHFYTTRTKMLRNHI
ncbi:hypothetical protein [Gibbsiella quercinecans]|uniref:hypothetical protein n=1 Tax=Gibbsiella quercinecans TaxID=929813 RepID=UPI003A4D3FA3